LKCCNIIAIALPFLDATYLNFYVSHRSATRLLINGEKYYIYFIDNLMLFPTENEFSKSVNG